MEMKKRKGSRSSFQLSLYGTLLSTGVAGLSYLRFQRQIKTQDGSIISNLKT